MDDSKTEAAQLTRELHARLDLMREAGDVLLAPRTLSLPPKRGENRQSSPLPKREGGARGENEAKGEESVETRLKALADEVSACRKCPLGSYRLRAVFGVGSPSAEVLFVGEGPGFQEDHKGEPFIGKAGQLLDKIIESIGLSRRAVYIANIVKCHPMVNPKDPEARSNDRPPTPEEIAACRPYLDEQIRIIAPKVIVTLGSVATKTLLGEDVPISKVRGLWREYRGLGEAAGAIKLLPTYHPAALLRNPNLKRDVWTDMKNLKKELETKP